MRLVIIFFNIINFLLEYFNCAVHRYVDYNVIDYLLKEMLQDGLNQNSGKDDKTIN